MTTIKTNNIFNSISQLSTRFAPSPTGYMHLGHIASALFVWGIARKLNAKVYLRIEDNDAQRSKDIYTKQIIKDLKWLGFKWVNQPFKIDTINQYRQSNCQALYQQYLDKLISKNLVYNCFCSKKDILKRNPNTKSTTYDNFCRNRNLNTKIDQSKRLRLILPEQKVSFKEILASNYAENSLGGDVLIKDNNNNYTYQYCVTVDDMHQGINLIIRGEDIFDSTQQQLKIRRYYNVEDKQVFAHHKLIYDSNNNKLSKSQHDKSILEYKELGYSQEQILTKAARKVGLWHKESLFNLSKIDSLFRSIDYNSKLENF